MLNRRSFLTGLIAAPVVVKAASLMPIRGIIMPVEPMLYKIRFAVVTVIVTDDKIQSLLATENDFKTLNGWEA